MRRLLPAFEDGRGVITDILAGELVDSVTIITTRGGAVRGNHYHRETTQYVYVISGRMRMTIQPTGQPSRSFVVTAGDLVVTPPNERHAMRALEDTVFLALSRGPRGGSGYEGDTVRLSGDEVLDPPDATPSPPEAPGGAR